MNETVKKLLDSLTDEQKEKLKACKSAEELKKFAADAGIALSDELLEAAAGGGEPPVPCRYYDKTSPEPYLFFPMDE